MNKTGVWNWVLSIAGVFHAMAAQAEYVYPSQYDGTYRLQCNDMHVEIYANVSGPEGLNVNFSQTIPLLCGDGDVARATFQTGMNDLLEQIVDLCSQSPVLATRIDCRVEAGRMVDAIVDSNLLLVDIVPDRVRFTAQYPNAFNWWLGVGYTMTLSQWLTPENEVEREVPRGFLFNNMTGEFLSADFPITNLLQFMPGCMMFGGGLINGKLMLNNLYDHDPSTHDLTSNLRSDASITCARHLAEQWYYATIGMRFRGSVAGERLD